MFFSVGISLAAEKMHQISLSQAAFSIMDIQDHRRPTYAFQGQKRCIRVFEKSHWKKFQISKLFQKLSWPNPFKAVHIKKGISYDTITIWYELLIKLYIRFY